MLSVIVVDGVFKFRSCELFLLSIPTSISIFGSIVPAVDGELSGLIQIWQSVLQIFFSIHPVFPGISNHFLSIFSSSPGV